MPRMAVTLGGWWRHSNALTANATTTWIGMRSGGSGIGDGDELLRVRVNNISTTFVGPIVTASSFSLQVAYLHGGTLTLTPIADIVDSWVDPALGLNAHTLRWIDIIGRRIAVGIRTSSYAGTESNPAPYNPDGEIHLYHENVEIWSATGLTFAHKQPFQTTHTSATFGVTTCMDRLWVRNGLVLPNADVNGVVPATADRLIYEDDGNLVDWTAWGPDPAALYDIPFVVSDVGAEASIGYSVGTGAGTTLVGTGGIAPRGMRRLVTLTEGPPPPPVITTACPVTLTPIAVGGGSACPVGGATLTQS